MASVKTRTFIINVATFIVLEVVSLLLLSSNTHQQTWIGAFATDMKAVVWGRVDKIHDYFHLQAISDSVAADNERLHKEVLALRKELSSGETEKWLKLRTNFETLGASVLAVTHDSQHSYMIIDKGREDGVHPDDGIVTSKGVVGIVKQVSDHYAQAMTFHNDAMNISAKVGHDGTLGTMKWDGKSDNMAILTGIALHCPIEKGDTVYTSGHTTIFPADIPLGVVTDKTSSSGSTLKINVSLFEDMHRLHYVHVVHNIDKEEINSLKK